MLHHQWRCMLTQGMCWEWEQPHTHTHTHSPIGSTGKRLHHPLPPAQLPQPSFSSSFSILIPHPSSLLSPSWLQHIHPAAAGGGEGGEASVMWVTALGALHSVIISDLWRGSLMQVSTNFRLSCSKASSVLVNWPLSPLTFTKLIPPAHELSPELNLQHLQSAITRNYNQTHRETASPSHRDQWHDAPGRILYPQSQLLWFTGLTFPALEHLRYAFVAPAVWFMAKNLLEIK